MEDLIIADEMSALIRSGSDILKCFAALRKDVDNVRTYDDATMQVTKDSVTVVVDFYTSDTGLPNKDMAPGMTLARLIELRRIIGGNWKKTYTDSYTHYKQDYHGMEIDLRCPRAATCRRVVVGTQQIAEHITPAYTREIVEWVCDD